MSPLRSVVLFNSTEMLRLPVTWVTAGRLLISTLIDRFLLPIGENVGAAGSTGVYPSGRRSPRHQLLKITGVPRPHALICSLMPLNSRLSLWLRLRSKLLFVSDTFTQTSSLPAFLCLLVFISVSLTAAFVSFTNPSCLLFVNLYPKNLMATIFGGFFCVSAVILPLWETSLC